MRTFNLLLIAISGVRVRNENLLRLGLTLPGFVERSKVIASLPSLSLLTIAGCCPNNWDVEYREIDELSEADISEAISGRYDLVGISSFTARINEAYALSDRLRGEGVRVVLGGLHVTALPHEAIAHADAIVAGDGEAAWPELIRDFEEGRLQPAYGMERNSSFADLATCAMPRYDLLDIGRYNRLTVQCTRGCPRNCTFCASSRLLGPYRKKPIDRIRAEIETILSLWERPFIELADDNTFVDKQWSRDMLRLFMDYKIKWFTEADISIAEDNELLELLALSGCAQVLIGLESPSVQVLRDIDPTGMKLSWHDRYAQGIRKIQSYGISVNGCFIFGHDTDSPECFAYARDYIKELELSEVQITLLTPFPGSSLYERLKREKRLISDNIWDKCTLFDLTYTPLLMNSDELEAGFNWLMSEIYSPDAVAARKSIFTRSTRMRLDKFKSNRKENPKDEL